MLFLKTILTHLVKDKECHIWLTLSKESQIWHSLCLIAISSLKNGYLGSGHDPDWFSVKFPFSTLSRHLVLFAYLALKKNTRKILQALATPAADRLMIDQRSVNPQFRIWEFPKLGTFGSYIRRSWIWFSKKRWIKNKRWPLAPLAIFKKPL